MNGYPDFVSVPGPKSRQASSVFSSIHVAFPFDSGSRKPPSTNCFVTTSNSRSSSASLPPFDSATRQRRSSGRRQVVPCHTQFAPSRAESVSTSSTVSHSGFALR